MENFIPKEITRFFITHKADGVQDISKSFISYYLGKHGVFVSDIKKVSESFIATVKYDNDKQIEPLYEKDTHPIKIRRIFKTAFYNDSEKFESQVIGLFAETAANLLGLLNGKKAVVGIKMEPHQFTELKTKFLDLAMKYRDEKKFDVLFDPKGANIFLKIRKVQDGNKTGVVIWLEDPNKLIR
jgi:hypothetical protein